jgi:hypothetical protein
MRRLPIHRALAAGACAGALLALAGCGGSGTAGSSARNAQPAPPSPRVAAAERPRLADFPAARGRTLRQLAGQLVAGPQVGLATSVYTPGSNRIAFGLIGSDGAFVYGRTAVYVAAAADRPARGPFLAPADSLQVRPAFRSRTSASDPNDVQAVYHATVELPRPGRWFVVAVTEAGSKYLGGTAVVIVRRGLGIPAVGDPAPRVHTPTLASVGGDVKQIDTRVPPDRMHAVDLADVLGKRPVALLFATPALCQSRVCGPVTDIAAQLQTVYGNRVAFIHNEVYVGNDVSKGLRPQLKAFGLTTEPWLFAIDRHGRVAARLEGAFGIAEFRQAIEAAIRR